jgi:hypothetical protein
MIDTNFNAVFDVSAIIWDEDDFKADKSKYYKLRNGVSYLFEKMGKEKPTILLRNELLNLMINEFPVRMLPNEFHDFINIVYSFLGGNCSTFIPYSCTTSAGISSTPSQIKTHYNNNTKNEVRYLISKMHTDDESISKYFTFKCLWNENNELTTKTEEKTNSYETIFSDNFNDLDDFFAKFKPKFEHNDKHDCNPHKTKDAWQKRDTTKGFISQLSCYKEKINTKPQLILNKAIKYKTGFIGYDVDNEVWVRFKCHKDNLFHGFDEYDNENVEIIPSEIKGKFNK